MTRPDARDYIDLGAYPLDEPRAARHLALLSRVRAELDQKGCAVLKGFVRADCLDVLVAEAGRAAPHAHRSFNRTNAYFTRDDPRLPADHPVRRFYERSNAFVPADNFGEDSVLRAIYEWPAFSPFIQAALGEPQFHRYADPLADVIVNVVEPGNGFPWHFDTNNYTVTLAVQSAESGGTFQYSPGLRSRHAENYERVRAVLDGDLSGVVSIELEPGDLQIFRGRYSLHRVAPVAGSRSRFVAIFSYAQEPDMVASPERCKQLYGRVLPLHLERAGRRNDRLLD